MSDEIDREITTRKVTSDPNAPVNGYRVSEERSTRVNNNSGSNAVIIGVLIFLAAGTGAIVYSLNNRPAATQIVVPNPVDTVKENKSTVIERNNTTIREVPTTPQPTPKVEINIPAPTVQIQPVAPSPAVTVTAKPVAPPVATPNAVTPSATPTKGSAN